MRADLFFLIKRQVKGSEGGEGRKDYKPRGRKDAKERQDFFNSISSDSDYCR